MTKRGAPWSEPALPGVLVILAAALFAYWAHALRAPFINDDYVFLDKTRGTGFASLWSTHPGVFAWYRPVSRELHYWTLQHLFGAHEPAFHVASFALWLGVMAAYFSVAHRIAGSRVAALATAGVAALAAWAVPLVWIAGVQELWMLVFALVCLGACLSGRTWLAAVCCAAALLSKETAAVLPALALAALVVTGRTPLRTAIARTLPLVLVTVAWALIHPALGGHWRHAQGAGVTVGAADTLASAGSGPASLPVAWGTTLVRTLLVPLSLDQRPAPIAGWAGPLVRSLVPLVLLGALAAWAFVGGRDERGRDPSGVRADRAFAFGIAWAAIGWLPVAWPGLGWHSYYTLLGAMGVWLALAAVLRAWRAIALLVIAGVVVLRAGQAATPSLDWGSEWYQNRSAEFLEFMRGDLLRKKPRVPNHARLFFSGVPSNVGFLTAGGPALRVWYGDSTLAGGFTSGYALRPAGIPQGPDLFFRYDSTAGWVEIAKGAEDVALARAVNPKWAADHQALAVALVRAGAWTEGAHEFEKLAFAEPQVMDHANSAGVSFAMAGDSVSAARWFAVAAAHENADDSVKRLAREFARYLKPHP